MTKRICEISETELQIKKEIASTAKKYEECYKMGSWNGSNFLEEKKPNRL